ncbi:MAG: hypothetical protein IH851_00710 [Armatimonadetes bacterium]|nr:hypothetical protein [Armatimonadota bacterium]
MPNSELQKAVERLHNCRAQFKETVQVTETLDGQPVWDGEISIFNIAGHPTARLCYAWSEPVPDSNRRRFYAVLHKHPIDGAQAALRASFLP